MGSTSRACQASRQTCAHLRAASAAVMPAASVEGRDVHEDRRVDAREDVDRHPVLTDGLDRLLERDLVTVDLDSLLRQLLGDLAVGDRAEEPVPLACLDAD